MISVICCSISIRQQRALPTTTLPPGKKLIEVNKLLLKSYVCQQQQ